LTRLNSRLDNANFTELLLSVLSRHWRRNDNVITRKPVDGGGDTVLVGGLQGINDTEDLSGVTTGGSRVGENETDLLVGVNDEDRADGQSKT
jgi:hypothetical protein